MSSLRRIHFYTELCISCVMRSAYAMYCRLISVHNRFGFSFQTTSKDFIK